MTRRAVLLLAVLPALLALTGLAAVARGLEAHGGPHADDADVVAAHRAGQDRLAGVVDELLVLVPGEVLDRRTSEECLRGRRAVGGLGVDDPYTLRCQAGAVAHVRAGSLPSLAADVAALHERLVAAGWSPREHALPQLAAASAGARAADLAAAGYDRDGTELSFLVSTRDARPAGGQDPGGARGWDTADRLAVDEYGLVLRLSAVTFEG